MSENGSWACMQCATVMPEMSDPSWRWTGELWQHKCPGAHPQAGHFDAQLLRPGQLPYSGLPGDWMEQIIEAENNLHAHAAIRATAVILPFSWAASLRKTENRIYSLNPYLSAGTLECRGMDVMFGLVEKPMCVVTSL